MEAIEYLKLATDKTEAGDLIKENNLTDAVVKLMSNYAEFRVKNYSIPAVVRRSEQLVCDCGNKLTDKELYFGQCLQCDKNVEEAN